MRHVSRWFGAALGAFFTWADFAQFKRIPLAQVRSDAVYQAERDLFTAEFNAEHWNSEVSCLRKRIARLKRVSSK